MPVTALQSRVNVCFASVFKAAVSARARKEQLLLCRHRERIRKTTLHLRHISRRWVIPIDETGTSHEEGAHTQNH